MQDLEMKDIVRNIGEFVKDLPIIRMDVSELGEIRRGYNGNLQDNRNMSTAYTWMIQAAGKCRFYASDLLYDIEAIEEMINRFARNILDGIENEAYIRYIAVRDMGVDSNNFIHSKIDPDGCWRYDKRTFAENYMALFRVTVSECEYCGEKSVRIATEEIGLDR